MRLELDRKEGGDGEAGKGCFDEEVRAVETWRAWNAGACFNSKFSGEHISSSPPISCRMKKNFWFGEQNGLLPDPTKHHLTIKNDIQVNSKKSAASTASQDEPSPSRGQEGKSGGKKLPLADGGCVHNKATKQPLRISAAQIIPPRHA